MPYAKCPTCGRHFHLNIGAADLTAWYRERHPEAEIGGVVTAECYDCYRVARGIEIPADELAHRKAVADGTARKFPTDGPPCPQCSEPLRTPSARQCFHCGADWH